MEWRYFNLLVISIFVALSNSCIKESTLDLSTDSLTIAKIYQPTGLFGKDAIIETFKPNQNFGDSVYFAVFDWTTEGNFNTARALIEFDLTDIPQLTKISSAKLSLYWAGYENLTEHAGENAFTISRITQPWDENTVTWNNQPLASTTNFVSVPKCISITQNYTDIDITTMVQHMIDYPAENYGFMLKLDEEIPYRLVILASSDCLDGSKRPKLVVYF